MLNVKLSKNLFICAFLVSSALPVHSMDWFYKNQKAIFVGGAVSACGLAGYCMWRNAQKAKMGEDALVYCASEEFHRGWLQAGVPYSPYELEEMVSHLVQACSQQEYVNRLLPFIQKRTIEYNTVDHWRILLPLEGLSDKEVMLLYSFFYSVERLAYLTREELFITTKHRLDPSNKAFSDIALLSKIKHEIQQLTIMAWFAVISGFAVKQEVGFLSSEAVAFIDKSSQQLNLRWIPLAFAMKQGMNCLNPEFYFTQKKEAQMKCSEIMSIMYYAVARADLSYEQYVDQTEEVIKQSARARIVLYDEFVRRKKHYDDLGVDTNPVVLN